MPSAMSRNSSSRSRCGRRGEEKSEIKYNLLDMNRRNGISILGRMLAPVSRSLNAAAARKLLDVKADAQTQKRVNTLARKCNEGELTPSERAVSSASLRPTLRTSIGATVMFLSTVMCG